MKGSITLPSLRAVKFLLRRVRGTVMHTPQNKRGKPVERGDDGVLDALGHIVAVPLADAWSARIRKHRPAGFLQDGWQKTSQPQTARASAHEPWMPSRSMVARTCSEPGVMLRGES